jgi:hypothetical protein
MSLPVEQVPQAPVVPVADIVAPEQNPPQPEQGELEVIKFSYLCHSFL